MKRQEILDKIKNEWERETKLVWDEKRWDAMEKILTTTPEGMMYLQMLFWDVLEMLNQTLKLYLQVRKACDDVTEDK